MKKNINGFTIIELLVFIAIFMLITLSLAKIDLKSIIEKNNFNSFNNQIISNIETIRNNSLNGKGIKIGLNLINPYEYRLYISTGSLSTSYKENSTSSYSSIENLYNVVYTNRSWVDSIECIKYDGTLLSTNSNINIYFKGDSITNNCSTSSQIIKIKTSSGRFNKEINFNMISGVITSK